MNNIRIFFFILFCCAFLCGPVWAQAEKTPGKIIVSIIDDGLQILRHPDFQSPEMMPVRQEKLWEILEPVFDFDEVGKRALGRYWLSLDASQKQRFTSSFTLMMKRMYLNKSDLYKKGDVQYVREVVKGNRGKVQTNFIKEDGGKIEINLSMSHAKGQDWKIYDIQIGGVSVLSNYRSQFNNILAKSDFEELMQKLNDKINEDDE